MSRVKQQPEFEVRFDPKKVELLSFGFLPAVLDWNLLSALLQPGNGEMLSKGRPLLYYVMDVFSELDPACFELYYIGNLLSVVMGDKWGAKTVFEKGRRFILTGLSQYPQSFRERFWSHPWQVLIFLAYTDIFEVEDLSAAAEVIREAANIPGGPRYLESFASRLSSKRGQFDVGLNLLRHLLKGAKTEELKKKFTQKLFDLEVSYYLFDLNEKTKSHQGIPQFDPWGGRLSRDFEGRIITSTPYQKVFGLH
ncbi:MAG: hypothetical protein ACO3A2_07680 [Bdellovibrionia bacterium]